MRAATLNSKGQITLPKEIRDALGVSPGDKLVFRRRSDGTIVVEAATIDFRALAGMLEPKRKGAVIEQIQEAIRKGWAGR